MRDDLEELSVAALQFEPFVGLTLEQAMVAAGVSKTALLRGLGKRDLYDIWDVEVWRKARA